MYLKAFYAVILKGKAIALFADKADAQSFLDSNPKLEWDASIELTAIQLPRINGKAVS